MFRSTTVSVALTGLATLLIACPDPVIIPLIGEDPEVSALIKAPQASDPTSSPVAAARRLHQALRQKDTELSWALLSERTRHVMNARAATIGVGGRELLDASTLPDASGRVTKVQFDEVLFGGNIVELALAPEPAPSTGRAVVRMVTREGKVLERS
ncbi:MAG: hypothetical protein QF464_16885, partial [Myxococcota bacterium]|nr:hypothetical protein [Myxococcota bacterium]